MDDATTTITKNTFAPIIVSPVLGWRDQEFFDSFADETAKQIILRLRSTM